jgi:hypothetical protein
MYLHELKGKYVKHKNSNLHMYNKWAESEISYIMRSWRSNEITYIQALRHLTEFVGVVVASSMLESEKG